MHRRVDEPAVDGRQGVRPAGPRPPQGHSPRALLDAVRRPLDGDEEGDVQQLADALKLLLLAIKGPVLAALAEYLPPHPDRAVHDRARRPFVEACCQDPVPGHLLGGRPRRP
jgi:hypothetical protein